MLAGKVRNRPVIFGRVCPTLQTVVPNIHKSVLVHGLSFCLSHGPRARQIEVEWRSWRWLVAHRHSQVLECLTQSHQRPQFGFRHRVYGAPPGVGNIGKSFGGAQHSWLTVLLGQSVWRYSSNRRYPAIAECCVKL